MVKKKATQVRVKKVAKKATPMKVLKVPTNNVDGWDFGPESPMCECHTLGQPHFDEHGGIELHYPGYGQNINEQKQPR